MATKKPASPAMEFLVDALKSNPSASYGDLKAKADQKRLDVYPIMYGRAQALLGIVKSAKRGARKASGTASPRAAAPAGRRGRQPDASSKSGRIRELLQTGMAPVDIAKKVKCTPALVYNVKARMAAGGGRGAGGGAGGGSGSGPAMKRGPGRPRATAPGSIDGLAGIVEAVKTSERERQQLRTVLEKLQSIIRDALD